MGKLLCNTLGYNCIKYQSNNTERTCSKQQYIPFSKTNFAARAYRLLSDINIEQPSSVQPRYNETEKRKSQTILNTNNQRHT